MRYHENLLLKFIESSFKVGDIRVVSDCSDTLRRMGEVFPFRGAAVDWKKFSIHRSKDKFASNREIILEILEYVSEFSLNGSVDYVGDNQIEFCLNFDMFHLPRLLDAIVEIPQHHYIFSLTYRWLIRLSFEDNLDFGIV